MLFRIPDLNEPEQRVIGQIDELWDRLRYQLGQPRRWYGSLRRIISAKNVQASNSIEGYNVSVEDAAALMEGQEAAESSDADSIVVRNYGDAMTYIISLADDSTFEYDDSLIKGLHFMMMKHDLEAMPGHFRPGAVWVWSTVGGEVVYEGPDAGEVPKLVQELCESLQAHQPEVTHWVRAAMAHLNLVMVHPFKDGNGRMGRALQTLVLARARIQSPTFLSIEEYLGANTPAYYEVLGRVGGGAWHPGHDARPWIRFSLTAQYRQAKTLEKRITESDRLWEGIDSIRRELGLDERNMGSLYTAAWGLRVRRRDHLSYADGISDRAATSDLLRLVEAGLLDPVGERRGRYYVASERLRLLRARTREPRRPIPDPFSELE
jgi:Fic family protein